MKFFQKEAERITGDNISEKDIAERKLMRETAIITSQRIADDKRTARIDNIIAVREEQAAAAEREKIYLIYPRF